LTLAERKLRGYFIVGDKVRLRQHQAWLTLDGTEKFGLKWTYPMPGKPQEFGFIVHMIDADTFLVRPRWKAKDFVMELYACELELIDHTMKHPRPEAPTPDEMVMGYDRSTEE
jgi:hypothetical protein